MVTQEVEADFAEGAIVKQLVLDRFEVGGRLYQTTRPLHFSIVYKGDESESLYVTEGEFGIHLFATTLQDVLEMLDEELPWLWTDYAVADPAELAPDAQQLRLDLRNRFFEVSDAS